MKINDRIIAFTRVRARDLKPNPRNWRTHPPRQREALRGLLAEIGYADALLVREMAVAKASVAAAPSPDT